MDPSKVNIIFFDLGDTLGTAELSASPPKLIAFHVFPFVPDLLRRCQERGFRLGIISNTGDETRTTVDPVISTSGILDFFDPVLRIYSGDVGMTKATPELFSFAAARAGYKDSPGTCLFVGEDSRERSVASEAGFRVCPHPLLIDEVIEGQHTRFVRIAPRAEMARSSWISALMSQPVVPLYISDSLPTQLFAVTCRYQKLGIGQASAKQMATPSRDDD